MTNKKIQIKIGSKSYPINISSDQEELMFRKAENEINNIIKDLSKKYSTIDENDILSMACIKLFIREYKLEEEIKNDKKFISHRISILIDRINCSLK